MTTPAERLARKKAHASPDRSDPLSTCRAYMGRLGMDDYAGAAALVDPRSLLELRKALVQLIAGEPDSFSVLRSMFPRLKKQADVEKTEAKDIYADFLTTVFSSSEELHEAFSKAEYEILAAAEEGPEIRHVVYRYRYALEGVQHGKVSVAPMAYLEGRWWMKADEDIKGLLNGISMRHRMSRSLDLPDGDVGEEKDSRDLEATEAAVPKVDGLPLLLKRLGSESLDMEDLEAEILPLLLSTDNDVVLGGMKLLKPLLSPSSIIRVLEQMTSPDHRVRWHCLDCLGEGASNAPGEIFQAFLDSIAKDPEPWVRKKAATELARYSHPSLLDSLRPFLEDPDLGLVSILLDAAAATDGSPKLLFLEEVVLTHPEVKIRDYARELLRDLSRPEEPEDESD